MVRSPLPRSKLSLTFCATAGNAQASAHSDKATRGEVSVDDVRAKTGCAFEVAAGLA